MCKNSEFKRSCHTYICSIHWMWNKRNMFLDFNGAHNYALVQISEVETW